jgi:uncharacterized membrane protein YecN with MAPEG domain
MVSISLLQEQLKNKTSKTEYFPHFLLIWVLLMAALCHFEMAGSS